MATDLTRFVVSSDAGLSDAGPSNADSPDVGSSDADSLDADSPDADLPDVGSLDAGSALIRAGAATPIRAGAIRAGAIRAGAIRAGAAADTTALAGLTTTTDECAEDVCRAPGAPCAGGKVLSAIASFVVSVSGSSQSGSSQSGSSQSGSSRSGGDESGSTTTDASSDSRQSELLPSADSAAAAAVRRAAAVLNCTSESCVVTHPKFRRFAAKLLPPQAIEVELETRFKSQGPRDTLAWTSNANLDDTLRRWARVFPEFYPCPYAMMDFEKNGDLFGRIMVADVLAGRLPLNLGPGFGVVSRAATCFGCILNTDVRSGPGKHWVAVFVDCRPPSGAPWTVEFFNSVGGAPPRPVVRWMERQRASLESYRGRAGPVRTVAATDRNHQESQSECGLYSLYYIRRRLEGTPSTFFSERLVPDEAMAAFRAHVFRCS